MWAAGAREKDVAVAATDRQLRAFVRADQERCVWQLRCLQDLAMGPEEQRVQATHWVGYTVSYCKSVWAVSLGLGPSLRIRKPPRGQFLVAVIYIGAENGMCVVCGRHGPSQLYTTRFRSGELKLPLPLPGAFLAPLSLAYGVHSTHAGRGWGRVHPGLGRGRFHSDSLRLSPLLEDSDLQAVIAPSVLI